jgi:hypothetical protein
MRSAVGNFVIASENGSRKGLVNQLDFRGVSVDVAGTTGTVVFTSEPTDIGPVEARISELEDQIVVLQAQILVLTQSVGITVGSNWRYSGITNTLQISDGAGNYVTPTYYDGGLTMTPV